MSRKHLRIDLQDSNKNVVSLVFWTDSRFRLRYDKIKDILANLRKEMFDNATEDGGYLTTSCTHDVNRFQPEDFDDFPSSNDWVLVVDNGEAFINDAV